MASHYSKGVKKVSDENLCFCTWGCEKIKFIVHFWCKLKKNSL